MSSCTHPPICPPSCDHCLAYDRLTRNLCARMPASVGSKWCSVHEELQAKLLKSYKRLTKAVESWDDSTLVKSMATIEETSDMILLRKWSELARSKWGLVNRVIVSREDHHAQFYAGGDWNHCLFVETLHDESARLERTMRALDRRAYALTLAKSDAEWVLAPSTAFVCNDDPAPSHSSPPTPPLTPPQSPLLLPTKSQRKKAHRKANKLEDAVTKFEIEDECCPPSMKESRHLSTANRLERMRAYLVPPVDLPRGVRKNVWRAFISGIFRYCIVRLPALAPLAMATRYESSDEEGSEEEEGTTLSTIEEFLDLLESRMDSRCGEEIDQLWSAIKFSRIATSIETGAERVVASAEHGFLGVGVLSDLLLDVYRTEEEREEKGVEILGGKVWKVASQGLLCDEGFDIFYQFIACSGCSLSITRSFASLMRNRRLSVLGHYPAYLTANESSSEHVFRLARLVLCGSNNLGAGKKVRRVEQKGAGIGGGKKGVKKIVIVEEWERAWAYLRAPLDDAWTLATLSALAADDRFSLLARDSSTSTVLHSPNPAPQCKTTSCHCCASTDLWLSKVRSGLTPTQRRTASFTTATFFPTGSIFESFHKSSCERRFGYDFSQEVIEILVMDNKPYHAGEADWNTFSESVAKVIISTSPHSNWSELLTEERREAIESGEMSLPMRIPGKVEVYKNKGGKYNSVFEEDFVARKMFREAS